MEVLSHQTVKYTNMPRKRRKRGELVKLQDKIWILCKNIIRLRYKHVCYTCGSKNLKGINLQTGHMISKKGLDPYMKYDLRILRPQCSSCNMRREGMGATYYRNMLAIEGQDYVDGIFKDLKVKVKPKPHYQKLLIEYKEILKNEQEDLQVRGDKGQN